MYIIVLIPAYNEEQTIGQCVVGASRYCDQVVVVNDGSFDATEAVAKDAGAFVLNHSLNLGQGAALMTGFAYALQHGADVVVTFDADAQHTASDIPRVVEPILRCEADVVIGNRYTHPEVANIHFSRKIMLFGALVMTRLLTGLSVGDVTNGFRAFSRHALQKMELSQRGMSHASEILDEIARVRLRYKEIPVYIRYPSYATRKGQKTIDGFRVFYEYVIGKMFK